MLGQFVRVVTGVLVSTVSGAVLGALYAGLVGAVHLGAYGRWDRVPAFAVGCVLVGAVLGLLGRMAWALSGEAARERRGCRSPPHGSRLPGSASGTADQEERGRGRHHLAAGGGAALALHPQRDSRI